MGPGTLGRMPNDAPRELRVVLTVANFDEAAAFYREAVGLRQVADWSTESGRAVLLEAGRATIELLDEAQAAVVDEVEAGGRVSGRVRLALEVPDSEETARRLVEAGVTFAFTVAKLAKTCGDAAAAEPMGVFINACIEFTR